MSGWKFSAYEWKRDVTLGQSHLHRLRSQVRVRPEPDACLHRAIMATCWAGPIYEYSSGIRDCRLCGWTDAYSDYVLKFPSCVAARHAITEAIKRDPFEAWIIYCYDDSTIDEWLARYEGN